MQLCDYYYVIIRLLLSLDLMEVNSNGIMNRKGEVAFTAEYVNPQVLELLFLLKNV